MHAPKSDRPAKAPSGSSKGPGTSSSGSDRRGHKYSSLGALLLLLLLIVAACSLPLAGQMSVSCPPGMTRVERTVGERDDFNPDPDSPEASPSDALLARVAANAWAEVDVDSQIPDCEFVHTFNWGTCSRLARAFLEIGVRASLQTPMPDTQLPTDTLNLWFTDTGYPEFSYHLWNEDTVRGDAAVVVLDLGALPPQGALVTDPSSATGSESLLDVLSETGFLDIRVQDDTDVDFARLVLCCEPPGCECGDWTGATVEEDWFAECGETVEMGMDDIQGLVAVYPHYSCVGTECGDDALTLYWEVFGPGGTLLADSGGQQAPPIEFLAQEPGTYRVKMEPSCNRKGCCEPCVVQIAISEDACNCGRWQDQDGNGTLDVAVDGVVVDHGSALTVSVADFPLQVVPSYACQGECLPIYPTYDVWMTGGITISDASSPISLPYSSFNAPGTYGCVITPTCGSQVCDPLRFTLVIEDKPPSCACGHWSDEIIHVSSPTGWETSVDRCPQTIELPPEVCASEFLEITPHYVCDPPVPPCKASYIIDVAAWGLHESFDDSYKLPLDQLQDCDQYTDVTITAFCNGMACDRCVLTLCCESECKCGKWGFHDSNANGTPDIFVGGAVVDEDGTVTVSASDFPLQLDLPDYVCQGPCPPVTYNWSTSGTTSHLDDVGIPIALQYSYFNVPGTYDQFVTANCGSNICDPFHFKLVIEDKPPSCACGPWSDEIIHVSSPTGWETSVDRCPQTIELPAEVCASELLEITPHYVCDPPVPPCKASYIIDVTAWGLHEPFDDSYKLALDQLQDCDEYTDVTITAFCDGMACDRCVLTLCCQAGCQCGEWEGVTIEGGQLVYCGQAVGLSPSEIQGPVTIVPHYECVGTDCPPDALTFFWEIEGPDNFYETSGTSLSLPAIEFDPPEPGTYLVTMMPSCEGEGCCDPCRIAVKIEGAACGCADDETKIEVMAGENDNFSPLSTATPSAHACPSQALLNYLDSVGSPFICLDFDSVQHDSAFCHTFDEWDECGEITKACLEVKLKAIGSQPGTDHLNLWFTDDSAYPGTSYSLWTDTTQAGDTHTILLDLGALPPAGSNLMNTTSGGISLLNSLNAAGYLDLHIQDDTSVDYAKLTLCCAEIPCECGEWQDADEDGVPDIMVVSSTVDFVNLGDILTIPPTGLPYLTIEPYYQCQGEEDCEPEYEWKLTGPGSFTAESNVASPGPIVLSELSQPATLDGVGQYQMTIVPYCDGHACDPFKFTFIRKCKCVEIGPPNPTPEWDKMVAWWPFEECNYDQRDGHGEAWAMNGSHPEVVNGVVGNAINVGDTWLGQYPYSVNHAWVSNHQKLNFDTGSFSIDCWIKPTDHLGTFIDKRKGQTPMDATGYALAIDPNEQLEVILNGCTYTSTLAVPVDQWSFIAVAVDRANDELHIRVNGAQDTASISSFFSASCAGWAGGDVSSAGPLLFGKDQLDASESFGGFIDEAEIYNDAMDPAFFEKIYEAGSCAKCTPHGGVPPEWKIHHPQWAASGGWDVECGSVNGKDIWLADDWKCTETGNVSQIILYGSWEDIDGKVEDFPGDYGTINNFTILIAEHNGSCSPGNILWRRVFGKNEFQEVPLGGCCWLNWYGYDYTCSVDAKDNDHRVFYKYTFAEIPKPFVQKKGEKYWLIVKPDIEEDERHWGWSSTEYRFFCDALWGEVEETLSGSWVFNPEGDLHWPSDCTKSLNLAFRISDGPDSDCGCVGWVDADDNGVPDVAINSQMVDIAVPPVVTPPITIYPFHECKCAPARFYWEIAGPNQFSFPSLTGPGDVLISLSPSSGTLDGPGTYKITLYPICDGEKCEPFTFEFVIEEPPPTCECSHWSDEIIHVSSPAGWETNVYRCPQTIELPPEVSASELLEITPHYVCDPPVPPCKASYIIDVAAWGLHESFDDSYKLPLDQLQDCDQYTDVTITAFCNGMACDRCVLKLCCESDCRCGKWHDQDSNGTPDVTVDGVVVDHGGVLTVSVADFPLQVVPSCACQGECLPIYPTYDVWMTGGVTISDASSPISLQYSYFNAPGTYSCVITPTCGSQVCYPLRFNLVIEEEPPTCECSNWSDEIIHIASPTGWATSVYECAQEIELPEEVCASKFLEITPHYVCDPPGVKCVSYIIDVPGLGLHESFDDYYKLDVEQLQGCDEYTDVAITAFCGDMACGACRLKLCCETGCECGKWEIEDSNGNGIPDIYVDGQVVDEGGTVTVSASDFPLQLDLPDYVCQGPCPPVTYNWSASGTTSHLDDVGIPIVLQYSYFNGPGTYDQFVTANCGSNICDPFHFKLEIEEEPPRCECSHWSHEIIHVSSPAGWETSVYRCPQTIELPEEVCASELLEITPYYVCSPPDPETCPVSYVVDVAQWGIHEQFMGSYTLALDDLEACPDSTKVCITAFCGGQACDQCCFTLCCAPQPCKCGGWPWHSITVNGQYVNCDEEVSLTGIGPVTVIPQYECIGTNCAATYMWEIMGPGGYTESNSSPASGAITFTPGPSGTYLATIAPYCAGVACPEVCHFLIHVPEAACKCNIVGDHNILVSNTATGWQSVIGTCNVEEIDLPSRVCSLGQLTITPDYWWCSGPGDCEILHYRITVPDLGIDETFASSYTLHFDSNIDCLSVCITGFCGSTPCGTCCFEICCEPPSCDCSRWGTLVLNGQAVTCGAQITVVGNDSISISTSYQCAGPACETRYVWEILGPNGFQRRGDGLPTQFTPGPLGTYMVNVTPLCDGKECPPCQALVVIKEAAPACSCGQWSDPDGDGYPEVWVEGNPVDCGGQIGMTMAQIVGPVTIEPTYTCSGGSCPPVLYRWSVSGPSGYSHSSGGHAVSGPMEFSPSGAGTYVASITPLCGSVTCQATRVSIVIEEKRPVVKDYRWQFATLEGGGLKMMSRQMPATLQAELRDTEAAAAALRSSTLPAMSGFNLDITGFSGTLTGILPSDPASYQLIYDLRTASGAPAGTLHVLIDIESTATRCSTPRIDLSTGVAKWEVLAPDAARYVPVQATLPNANWAESPNEHAVWVDHNGTSAGRGYVEDPEGDYVYRVSFDIDTLACCGRCPLAFQYAADDSVRFYLETPTKTYDLCALERGCCAPDGNAYGKLSTCSINLCDLNAGPGRYVLRAHVENQRTVTGLLVVGGVTCP